MLFVPGHSLAAMPVKAVGESDGCVEDADDLAFMDAEDAVAVSDTAVTELGTAEVGVLVALVERKRCKKILPSMLEERAQLTFVQLQQQRCCSCGPWFHLRFHRRQPQ